MKRLKKYLLTLLLVLAFASPLSAFVNNSQKIFPIGSEVYEALCLLYFSHGRVMPSNTGPWNADELNRMLKVLDYNALSKVEKDIYEFVEKELNLEPEPQRIEYDSSVGLSTYLNQIQDIQIKKEEKGVAFKFGFGANLELYTHSNTSDLFVGKNSWVYNFIDQKPFFYGTMETWPGNHFYAYFEAPFGNYLYTQYDQFGENIFNTNILGLQDITRVNFNDLDLNQPFRAFASIGGNNWNIQLGRDRMSWGPGVVSNFVVGDNLKYHNMLRFTTFFDTFKYSFVLSFFPHPQNYADSPLGWGISPYHQHSILNGINMFMSHRLEWRFLDDMLKLVLTEGVMYQSATNYLDLQIINPIMFFHDLYMRSNANSIASIELEYSPIRHLNVYFQFLIDEIAGFGEAVSPNGFAYMLGAKSALAMEKGMLYASIEWALTDPYLYLRDRGYEDAADTGQKEGEYGINYVVANRYLSPRELYYDEHFLGYKYGGDAITLNLNCGYKVYNKWWVESNLFYMAHGTHDKWTCWQMGTSEVTVGTPTTNHYTDNHKGRDAVDGRNSVSHNFTIGFNGGYTILDGLDVYSQLDLINVWNAGNIRGNYQFDLQWTVGLSYAL